MNQIIKDTQVILDENRAEWEPKFLQYFRDILKNETKILALRKQFKMNGWLRAYLNVGQAKSSKPIFSIRYGGQEVGQMLFKDCKPYLKINGENNKKYFKLSLPSGEYSWQDSREAKQFRDRFEKVTPDGGRVGEHKVESLFIDELQKKSAEKFCGTLRFIQPVRLFNKIPFQMPVPVSGSSGVPSPTRGNIDILARYGRGKGNLSILELKGINRVSHTVIKQALIYAITMKYMLEETSPNFRKYLWKLCGYASDPPPKILLNAIVATTKSSFNNNRKKEFEFLRQEVMDFGISLHYLIYEISNSSKIEIIEKSL